MGWREAVQGDASSPLKYALKIVEPIIDPLAFLMVAYLQVRNSICVNGSVVVVVTLRAEGLGLCTRVVPAVRLQTGRWRMLLGERMTMTRALTMGQEVACQGSLRVLVSLLVINWACCKSSWCHEVAVT